MKRFGSQLNKQAQSLRLTRAERADLRDRVVTYMEYHPLPKEKLAKQPETTLTSQPFYTLPFSRWGSALGAFAVLVMMIVPAVAERSVPGDVLYPVKVQFNEELRSTLAFSPYAKVEWETKRLERRLAEARLLADEGKLTEELEAEVAVAVQAHSDAAKQEIETIRASDSDEATIAEITFASALEVQSEVLENRQAQAGQVGRSVANLADVVNTARSGVEAATEAANPSYEKLLARIETETTYAQELFSSIRPTASVAQVSDIERRFADIKRKVEEAIILHNEVFELNAATGTEFVTDSDQPTQEKASKNLLKEALSDTKKLLSFMTDIEVRNTVSIDDLVPVILTEAEKRADLNKKLNTLKREAVEVSLLEPQTEVEEKFETGLIKLNSILLAVDTALVSGKVDEVMPLVDEGLLMVTDLKNLLVAESKVSTPTKELELEVDSATGTATSTVPRASSTDAAESVVGDI